MADKKNEKAYQLEIPIALYNKLKKRVEEAGFGSVEEYVLFILNEVVEETGEEEPELSEEDEKKIKERLRSLGYLD